MTWPKLRAKASDRQSGDNRSATQFRRGLVPTLTALVSAVAVSTAAANESSLCSQVLSVIDEAPSRFLALRGEPAEGFGDYKAKVVLEKASSCVILEDAQKGSYHCVWTYPLGAAQAHEAFEILLGEVRLCLAELAEEKKDEAVNHPDTYASYLFEAPGSTTSINLKNKSALKSTLVSIRIDGPSDAR